MGVLFVIAFFGTYEIIPCWARQSDMSNTHENTLLLDLPESVARSLVQMSIAKNLIASEYALISHYITSDDIDIEKPTRKKLMELREHLTILHDNKSTIIDREIFIRTDRNTCVSINESQVCFMDPAFMMQQCQTDWSIITSKLASWPYVNQDTVMAEWHNFIVYYMKMRVNRIKHISTPPPA
jgi:hypothetical protein